MNRFVRPLAGIVLCLVLLTGAGQAWAEAAFVFVAPAAPADDLGAIVPVGVRGGKALPFRQLGPGQDPRADAVARALAASPACKQVLSWWDQARRLAPPPCQKWIGADGPIPVWVKTGGAGRQGPGMVSLVPIQIETPRGGRHEASQLLVLEDLRLPDGTLVTVEEMNGAGLLVPMVCHEACHGLMADLYRERFLAFSVLGTSLGGAHDSPVETDPHLAFREGFAEAGELVLARRFPREFYATPGAGVRPAVQAFARTMAKHRVALAGRNRFIFTANGRVKDGQLKTGATDHATEGVIAALLETLVNHANWPSRGDDHFPVLFRAMARQAPLTFFGLVNALLAEAPAQAETIRRILVEYTCYTIRSPEAARQYEQYYLSRKAFVQGKLGRDEFAKARAAWQAWKDGQRRRVEAGAPVWEAAPEPFVVAARNGFALDLNDTDPERLAWHLEAFLPTAPPDQVRVRAAKLAAAVVARRGEVGVFTSLDPLRGVVPARLYASLEAGRRRQEQRLQEQIDDLVARRRQAGRP